MLKILSNFFPDFPYHAFAITTRSYSPKGINRRIFYNFFLSCSEKQTPYIFMLGCLGIQNISHCCNFSTRPSLRCFFVVSQGNMFDLFRTFCLKNFFSNFRMEYRKLLPLIRVFHCGKCSSPNNHLMSRIIIERIKWSCEKIDSIICLIIQIWFCRWIHRELLENNVIVRFSSKNQPLLFCQETYTSIMTRITTLAQYYTEYQFSLEHPEAFWEQQARELTWKKPWDRVLKWDFETPDICWFEG